MLSPPLNMRDHPISTQTALWAVWPEVAVVPEDVWRVMHGPRWRRVPRLSWGFFTACSSSSTRLCRAKRDCDCEDVIWQFLSAAQPCCLQGFKASAWFFWFERCIIFCNLLKQHIQQQFGATYTLWVQQRRLMPLLLKYISEGHLFLLQIPSLIMTHCYRIDSYRSYIHLHCETEFKPISKIIVILLLFLSFKWWRLCTLTWIMPNNTPLTNIKAVSVIFSADLFGPHI